MRANSWDLGEALDSQPRTKVVHRDVTGMNVYRPDGSLIGPCVSDMTNPYGCRIVKVPDPSFHGWEKMVLEDYYVAREPHDDEPTWRGRHSSGSPNTTRKLSAPSTARP